MTDVEDDGRERYKHTVELMPVHLSAQTLKNLGALKSIRIGRQHLTRRHDWYDTVGNVNSNTSTNINTNTNTSTSAGVGVGVLERPKRITMLPIGGTGLPRVGVHVDVAVDCLHNHLYISPPLVMPLVWPLLGIGGPLFLDRFRWERGRIEQRPSFSARGGVGYLSLCWLP